MKTIKFKLKDGTFSESIKGVYWLDSEDCIPTLHAIDECDNNNAACTNAQPSDNSQSLKDVSAQDAASVSASASNSSSASASASAGVSDNAPRSVCKTSTQDAREMVDLKQSEGEQPGAAQQQAVNHSDIDTLLASGHQEGLVLSSAFKARSFASLQLRARNAMRALFRQRQEHLLVVCVSTQVDGISTCADLVREVAHVEPTIAYAPTKFELFGNDKEDGLLTVSTSDQATVVVMPCMHLADHPKWLGMLDACLAQNSSLKLILCGDGSEIAALSMMWPTLDNAIHTDVVLEFPSEGACKTIASLISHYQKSHSDLLPFSSQAVSLLTSWCCRTSGDRRYIGLLELKLQSLIFEANNYALNQGKDDLKLNTASYLDNTCNTHAALDSEQDAEQSAEQSEPSAAASSLQDNTTALCASAASASRFVKKWHVLKALAADDFRNNYLAGSSLRDHRDRQLLIATEGKVVGQINGLSVIETLGTSYEYGEPVRITATIRAGGEGDVIDIERKAELAGQIHAKAMMIINGFLTEKFGANQPLPVSASLVFEQSYSEVDGDSASLTGLCAIISSLADVPIRQDLAVTGAVDQFGDVQAVGGVNEKIEGFFRVCRLNGLTGTQGVIIPSACVNQLVLRPSVVRAIAQNKFHIFTVNHVTSAMKLLTGADWGDSETEGTICYSIVERLNNILSTASEETWMDKISAKFSDFSDLFAKCKTHCAVEKIKAKLKSLQESRAQQESSEQPSAQAQAQLTVASTAEAKSQADVEADADAHANAASAQAVNSPKACTTSAKDDKAATADASHQKASTVASAVVTATAAAADAAASEVSADNQCAKDDDFEHELEEAQNIIARLQEAEERTDKK